MNVQHVRRWMRHGYVERIGMGVRYAAGMRAAWYKEEGKAADVLQTQSGRPIPSVGIKDILVKLETSGVNPTDCKRRAGGRDVPGWDTVIPHSDGAGVVEEIGSKVETHLKKGDRVWVWNARWKRDFGTAAEYVALPADKVASLPEGISFEQGATLGIPCRTAHRCLAGSGPLEAIAGENVLIAGGTGSVGSYAVQLAKWAGANVIATVGTAEGMDKAKSLGADHVINYREEHVAECVADVTNGKGVSLVVECEFGKNINRYLEHDACLAQRARIAAYGSQQDCNPVLPFYPLMYRGVDIDMIFAYELTDEQEKRGWQDINRALEEGALKSSVAKVLPLSAIVEAHELVEAGSRGGSVVLSIRE